MSEENQDSVESESPPRKYANKYESPEDLESAYNSLNKKFSSTLREFRHDPLASMNERDFDITKLRLHELMQRKRNFNPSCTTADDRDRADRLIISHDRINSI